MMGTKKLSEIRIELLRSLGKDPIGRLDRMIANAKRAGESTELTEGLKELLQRGPIPKFKKRTVSREAKEEGVKIAKELERFARAARKAAGRKKPAKKAG
jgi:hypothetical protein